MRLAFHLPGPRRTGGLTVGDVVDLAVLAESLGVHAVAVSDHPFPIAGPGSPAHHTYDPFVLLAYVGARTSRLGLHFSLLVAGYRNPFLTASMLATLQAPLGDRVVVGLGAGYHRPEFAALGATYAGRGTAVEGVADALRRAWTGEPVHATGPSWAATGNSSRPVPTSRPPLWRGGNGPTALRAAAGYNGWMPFEAGRGLAAGAGTRMCTVDTLVPLLADPDVRHGADLPGDIGFVRTDPRWLEHEDRASDDLGRLGDAGVSWVESGTRGRTRSEAEDDLRRLAAIGGAP